MELTSHPRRRFLQAAGVGTFAAAAGCLDDDTEEAVADEPTETDDDTEASLDGEPTVALVLQPGEDAIAEFQERQVALQEQLEEGEITEEEFEAELADLQEEILDGLAEEFETLADEEGITIESREEQFSAYLVSAPAETLIGTLDSGLIEGLFPASIFDEFGAAP